MTVYTRTRAQKQNDFHEAREYEEYFGERLGVVSHSRFNSTTELDIWVPGYMIEIKEKKQKYTSRWHLLDDVPHVLPLAAICLAHHGIDELTSRDLRHSGSEDVFEIRTRGVV